MCDRVGLGLVIALAVLALGGCAASMSTAPPPSSDTGTRAPAVEGPTNFGAPADIFQRYPELRRQTI